MCTQRDKDTNGRTSGPFASEPHVTKSRGRVSHVTCQRMQFNVVGRSATSCHIQNNNTSAVNDRGQSMPARTRGSIVRVHRCMRRSLDRSPTHCDRPDDVRSRAVSRRKFKWFDAFVFNSIVIIIIVIIIIIIFIFILYFFNIHTLINAAQRYR